MRARPEDRNRERLGFALLAALLASSCGGGGSSPTSGSALQPSSPSSAVVALHAGNFETAVAEGVSLIEFFHPACPHCRAMEPVVEQLATDFEGRAVVGKVDVTSEGLLTQSWGVHAYPTFLVLKDGQEVDRWLGETSYSRLAGMIRTALNAP